MKTHFNFLGWRTSEGFLAPAIRTPSKILLAGQSLSGKTTFLKQLLEIRPFESKFLNKNIYYYFMENQKLMDEIKEQNPGINLISGFPETFPSNEPEPTLIILDDMMDQIGRQIITDLFIRESHHRNITCILVTQNLFYNHRSFRLLSLNAQFLCVFKNARDQSQITSLSRQVYPLNPTFIQKVYWSVIEDNAYSYIWLDLSQKTKDSLRIWSNILQPVPIVYPLNTHVNFQEKNVT